MSESEVYKLCEGKTIVVVAAAEYMRRVLNGHLCLIPGINVDTYSDGEYALDALQQHNADIYLLIVETHLEQLNSLALVRKIRAGDTHADRALPVIVVGPKDGNLRLRELAKKLDVHVYVEQPISYETTIESLRKAIRMNMKLMPSGSYARINADDIGPP